MNKFSVLIPVSNQESPANLKRCLNSILNQTIKPNEIVVVKDGKFPQKLNEVLKEYKLKIIELNEHKGIGYALNVGIKTCKYDIIARMDSDDIALSNRFELQLNRFKKNKKLTILGGQILEFDEKKIKKIRKVPTKYEDILKYSKRRCPFNHMSVMYKKNSILKIGNYSNIPHFEDYQLWITALKKHYYVENLDETIILANNNSNTIKNRGGLKYIKPTIKFQVFLLKANYINMFEFIKNIFIRITVAIVPNKIRAMFYNLFLRKKYKNNLNEYKGYL